MDNKKKRGVNFTYNEINSLMQCLLPELKIIENKKTDGATLREKQNAWERVRNLFNSVNSNDAHRDINSIKTKYDNIKRTLKKKISNNKQNINKTGGGPPVESKLLWYEEELFAILQLGIEGLDPQGDSDFPTESMHEIPDHSYSEIVFDEVCDDNQLIDIVYGNEESTENVPPATLANDVEMSREELASTSKTCRTPLSSNKWNLKRKRCTEGVVERKKTSLDSFQKLTQEKIELTNVQKKCFELELEMKTEERKQKVKEWELKKQILEVDLQTKKQNLEELIREAERKKHLFDIKLEQEKVSTESMKCDLNAKLKKSLEH